MHRFYRRRIEDTLRTAMGEEQAQAVIGQMDATRAAFKKRLLRVGIPAFAIFVVGQAVLIPLTSDPHSPYSWASPVFDVLFLVVCLAALGAMVFKDRGVTLPAPQRKRVMAMTLGTSLFTLVQFLVMVVAMRTNNFNLLYGLIAVDLVLAGVLHLFWLRARTRLTAKVAELQSKE